MANQGSFSIHSEPCAIGRLGVKLKVSCGGMTMLILALCGILCRSQDDTLRAARLRASGGVSDVIQTLGVGSTFHSIVSCVVPGLIFALFDILWRRPGDGRRFSRVVSYGVRYVRFGDMLVYLDRLG